MSNIADMIESYILRQLAARQDGQVELIHPHRASAAEGSRLRGYDLEDRRAYGYG